MEDCRRHGKGWLGYIGKKIYIYILYLYLLCGQNYGFPRSLQLFPSRIFEKKDLPGDLIAEVHARRARDPRKFQEAMRDAGRAAGRQGGRAPAGPRQGPGSGVHSHEATPMDGEQKWKIPKINDVNG